MLSHQHIQLEPPLVLLKESHCSYIPGIVDEALQNGWGNDKSCTKLHLIKEIQWIPSVLRKTLNSCWPKTYGKKDMEKIWKIMGWSALLPKIKKRTKTLRDPTIITFTHFWGLWGVFRRQMCPVTSGRVDNCVCVGQRPYACLTISGSGVRCAANARHCRQLCILFPWWKRSPSIVSSHICLI